MNRINFQDTHVYPGCLALFSFKVAPNNTTMVATAEFSDGTVADAEVEQVSTGEVIVRIDGYTTTRGTNIPQKTWRLKHDHKQNIWKVDQKVSQKR